MERLDRAIAAIDAANAADPNTLTVDGVVRPKEQAHAELMTAWVRRLDPDADEAQLIAARAHHLRRWSIPRDDYADGRAGYLKWRTALKKQHADEVASILTTAGYDDDTIARVQRIIRKDGLGRSDDDAVQTHEDALCLVFLETQLDELASKMGNDKTVAILQTTAKKMSPAGLEAAHALRFSPPASALLERALAAS